MHGAVGLKVRAAGPPVKRGGIRPVTPGCTTCLGSTDLSNSYGSNGNQMSARQNALALLLAAALLAGCSSAPATPEEHARALFDRYVELEKKYDPAILDLYADGGRIEKYIITRSGQRVSMGSVPLSTWKRDAAAGIAGAEERGARNTYSDVTFEPDGDFVRIRMKRLQEPPGVTLAQELLVGPGPDGRWLIWNEVAQAPSTRQ